MGLLDDFERGLERVVNGAFAKTFRSGLQPVEVSAALKRELETKAAVVSRERILVPNRFVVHLSPGDHERFSEIGQPLVDDFVGIVEAHAQDQGFQFAGAVTVELESDDKLTDGLLQIESSNVQTVVSWLPVLDVAGRRYPLRVGATTIGRSHEADITVDDAGISRKHLQINWDGANAQATDLGSTNGSQLNGSRFTNALLQPESMIQIGRTSVIYRIVPWTDGSASPTSSAAPSRASAPAEAHATLAASEPARPPGPEAAPPASAPPPDPVPQPEPESSPDSPSAKSTAFWRDL